MSAPIKHSRCSEIVGNRSSGGLPGDRAQIPGTALEQLMTITIAGARAGRPSRRIERSFGPGSWPPRGRKPACSILRSRADAVDLEIRKALEELIDECSLRQALEAFDFAMWDHHARRPPGPSQLHETRRNIRRLDPDEVGAEIDRIIDRLLEVASAIGLHSGYQCAEGGRPTRLPYRWAVSAIRGDSVVSRVRRATAASASARPRSALSESIRRKIRPQRSACSRAPMSTS